MSRRIEPLSPEERDLAERIARLGGMREPAPALDAMILAAARAAVEEDAKPAGGSEAPPATPSDPKVTPIRPRRTVPRWQWGMGLAASVVLAAGIGWKLQGDGEGSSAEKSASAASAVYHDEATEAVMIEQAPAAMPPPPPPLDSEADAGALARRAAQAPAQTAAKPAPGGSADAFVADAPMADAASPVVSPAPAASAAQQAAEPEISVNRESKGVVDLSGTAVPRSEIASDRAVGAAEYTRTPLDQRREQARPNRAAAAAEMPPPPPPPAPAASPRERARSASNELRSTTGEVDKVSDAYDDRPPVSADSPEFRQAWLQRIRAQLTRGENAAAAENLQAFRRRYPDVELPEDLRKLAATLPPPAP